MNNVAIEFFTEYESSGRNGTHLSRSTGDMTPSNTSVSEENLAYGTQKSPEATELRALSQPQYSGNINQYPNYVYPVEGRTSYIYHVEVGIDENHADFAERTVEWLYTESSRERGAATRTEANVANGHSTCTASKAVGNLYGASKRATLVVVKMPDIDRASVYEVLDTVIDDITRKRRRETSVVSISWGTTDAATPAFHESPLALKFNSQIRKLINMRVVVVCAAGNAAQTRTLAGQLRTLVDTYPAAFGDRLPSWPTSFLVIGNSDINGVRYPNSQQLKNYRQLYAPGVNVKCASNTSPTGYKSWTGTSFCESPLTNVRFLTDRFVASRTSCSWCPCRSNFHGAEFSQSSPLVEKIRWPRGCLEFGY